MAKKERSPEYWDDNPVIKQHENDDLGAMVVFEHLEELKKHPPASKMGKKKLNFYKKKIKEYG